MTGVDDTTRAQESRVSDFENGRGRGAPGAATGDIAIVDMTVEGEIGAVGGARVRLSDVASAHDHVGPGIALIAEQVLVNLRVVVLQVVSHELPQHRQDGHVIEASQIFEIPPRRQAAALDEHDRSPPGRDVVAEGAGAPVLVVSSHPSGHERRQRLDDRRAGSLGEQPLGADGSLWIAGHRQNGIGRQHSRIANRRATVLVVEVEAQHRLMLITDSLQDLTFGSGQVEGVAIDIDRLKILSHVDL